MPDVGTESDAWKTNTDALPGPARAKAKVYCRGTSCYAAAFEFANYPSDPIFGGPYTLFTAYFQNLQGTYPLGGSSTPLVLNWLYFQFISSDEDPRGNYVDAWPHLSSSIIGNVQAGLNNFWAHDGPADSGPPNYDTFYSYPGGGIVGCNVDQGNPPYWFSFQTCPSQGVDGWVKFDFVLRRLTGFAASQPPVRFDDFLFSFGDFFSGGRCTIGGKQPGTCTELPYRRAMRP